MYIHWRHGVHLVGDEAGCEPQGARSRLFDAAFVFEGVTFTFEDDRFSYSEQRFVTLGLLAGIPVSVVHTESENEIRIISFRKATKREAQIYFSEIQN